MGGQLEVQAEIHPVSETWAISPADGVAFLLEGWDILREVRA